MAKFNIKKKIPGIDSNTKGGVLDGKTFITNDAAWIKELRKLPKGTCEEVVEDGD